MKNNFITKELLYSKIAYTGRHQMPKVEPYQGELPHDILSFNRVRKLKKENDVSCIFILTTNISILFGAIRQSI